MPQKRRQIQYSRRPGDPPPTLLAADSNPVALAELYQWLVDDGFAVLVTETVDETLAMVRDRKPQLLILGAELFDGTGKEVCEEVKNDDRLGFVPVICLQESTLDDPHLFNGNPLNGASDCPADVVLMRPVNLDELRFWTEHLLRIKRQFTRLMHENEDLLEAAQTIEHLKRDIITNVSHELRTPLVQVKAAVSLLAEDMDHQGSQGQSSVAEMAAQSVARLESAIENIRQLAQTHEVRPAPVDIIEAIDLAMRILERRWISREATNRVVADIEANLPLVQADKRALARLLQLLLDNALKFSEDDTPVYIIAHRENERDIWLGVRDFGIGIPEDEQERVFDLFYQVDASSTRRYGGTGSGLALAALLSRSMQTEIKLDSTVGEGSTFSFLLPLAPQPDTEAQ